MKLNLIAAGLLGIVVGTLADLARERWKRLKLWTVIFAVGVLNYLSRLSFIAFFANRTMPPLLARALKFVPAAMLTALIVPMVVVAPSARPASRSTRVSCGGDCGGRRVLRARHVPTLVTGMAALWVLAVGV